MGEKASDPGGTVKRNKGGPFVARSKTFQTARKGVGTSIPKPVPDHNHCGDLLGKKRGNRPKEGKKKHQVIAGQGSCSRGKGEGG